MRIKIIIVALIIGLIWRAERIASEEGGRVTPPEALSAQEGEVIQDRIPVAQAKMGWLA